MIVIRLQDSAFFSGGKLESIIPLMTMRQYMEDVTMHKKEALFSFNNAENTQVRLKFYYIYSAMREADMQVREMREFIMLKVKDYAGTQSYLD